MDFTSQKWEVWFNVIYGINIAVLSSDFGMLQQQKSEFCLGFQQQKWVLTWHLPKSMSRSPFQEPNLEVPSIYKVHDRPMSGDMYPQKHGFRWYDRPKWPVIVCSGWHCRFTLWQSNLAVRNSPLLDELHISLFDYPRATSNKPGQQQLCGRIPQKIVWIWSANMDTRCT